MAKEGNSKNNARIEGGVEAIVLGANADGLIAAAYLARAGLRTVLLEAGTELGLPTRERLLKEGVTAVDGEHLIFALDPVVIEDLDLFRQGISYAPRRLETTYFFENAESWRISGDLVNAAQQLEDPPAGFEDFLNSSLTLAAALRPLLAGAPNASGEFLKSADSELRDIFIDVHTLMNASAEEITFKSLGADPARTAMLSEAAFRSAAMPSEAFSFSPLLARVAGEVSGLQGAMAIPAKGMTSVLSALRRAAQTAKVDIRAASPVTEILIEQDRAAGVVLRDGGQVRAPIVVSALDEKTTFMELIGAHHLDLEFQRLVTMPAPQITSAQYHALLSNTPRDEATKENMKRRLVFAPEPHDLRRAFLDACNGDIPETFIIEMIFTNAFEDEEPAAPQLSVFAHPLPLNIASDEKNRDLIKERLIACIENFAPGLGSQIDTDALVLAQDMAMNAACPLENFASRPGLFSQLATSAGLVAAGGIGGLYYCGPKAQIGFGINGAAGRNAALAALGKIKRIGAAP